MTRRDRSVVIHAHFYQPPREDPWLEAVPRELSAAPFHDWNSRIEHECYRAVTAARIPGADGRIASIVNTLDHVSFDAGATLLAWLERAAPETHRRFIEADRASVDRLGGHGNAIAAPYHHTILPLASRRDKRTEVLWGLADFQRRFGRTATGCWLPETAVDDETLDVLAECGVQFTILAPHQVETPPDRGHPGRYVTAAGRELAVALYDGALSHDVAFGTLTRDAAAWAAAVRSARADLVGVATDGETFGHHHRFGEMALAALLADLARHGGPHAENYASWLARHPASVAVTLRAPSSWSCDHGVERWRADCGCRVDTTVASSQAWRTPLREGLVELQDALHGIFTEEGGALFRDPWAARDAYGAVLAGTVAPAAFLEEWVPGADESRRERARSLLEMERHALGLMTSCGWFFDDVSGLASIQVLRYAARAIELAGPGAGPLEPALIAHLATARSNDPAVGTAADLYRRDVLPLRSAPTRVAAGVAAARSLGVAPADVLPEPYEVADGGAGALVVRHRRTGRTRRVKVDVTRARPGQIAVATDDGLAPQSISLEELPECAADRIAARLRRELMDLWLDETEASAMCDGTPLADIVHGALRRAILALEPEAAPLAVAQVLDLLDLGRLCRVPVPWEAQTLFAAVRHRLPADARPRVAPIAERLGFA